MWFPFGRSPPEAVLRPAVMADASSLSALHARCFAHPWSTLTFESMLIERGVYGHVGEARGLVGFILSRVAADEAEILSVAVDPKQRGAGLGRKLVDANLDALGRARVLQVFLEVEDGNRAAVALYSRAGFEQVGRRQGYYRAADGTRRDALMMRINLKNRDFRAPLADG